MESILTNNTNNSSPGRSSKFHNHDSPEPITNNLYGTRRARHDAYPVSPNNSRPHSIEAKRTYNNTLSNHRRRNNMLDLTNALPVTEQLQTSQTLSHTYDTERFVYTGNTKTNSDIDNHLHYSNIEAETFSDPVLDKAHQNEVYGTKQTRLMRSHKLPTDADSARQSTNSNRTTPTLHHKSGLPDSDNTTPKKTRRMPVATMLSVMLVIVAISASLVTLRKPFMALIKPNSPFTEELATKMKIPLYYPTRLPNSFKLELDSITEPQAGVLLYSLSNNDGKKVSITIQKQPDNMESILSSDNFTDSRELKTKFNNTRISKSKDGSTVVNIMTGQSWLLMTLNEDLLTDKDITSIVNSLEF